MRLNSMLLVFIHIHMLFFSGHGPAKAQTQTGITGNIRTLRGNQMPFKGKANTIGHATTKEIYIYSATPINETEGISPLFSKIKTRLIAVTKSDSTGRYSVKVDPGKYSVFVKVDDKFFSNEIDNGYLSPVEVHQHSFATKDITITTHSAF